MKDEKKLTLHLKVRVSLEKMAQKKFENSGMSNFRVIDIHFIAVTALQQPDDNSTHLVRIFNTPCILCLFML